MDNIGRAGSLTILPGEAMQTISPQFQEVLLRKKNLLIIGDHIVL